VHWFVFIWYGLSFVSVVLGRVVFAWSLERRGAKVQSLWLGMPGYVESVYREWCAR